mmetsp:Transcript_58686/g.138289  ORF Transcript_58686/g.138289 Transcript_58686/m.138289 type:complete len:242 (+) Transcript_58686:293-1018(+)
MQQRWCAQPSCSFPRKKTGASSTWGAFRSRGSTAGTLSSQTTFGYSKACGWERTSAPSRCVRRGSTSTSCPPQRCKGRLWKSCSGFCTSSRGRIASTISAGGSAPRPSPTTSASAQTRPRRTRRTRKTRSWSWRGGTSRLCRRSDLPTLLRAPTGSPQRTAAGPSEQKLRRVRREEERRSRSTARGCASRHGKRPRSRSGSGRSRRTPGSQARNTSAPSSGSWCRQSPSRSPSRATAPNRR